MSLLESISLVLIFLGAMALTYWSIFKNKTSCQCCNKSNCNITKKEGHIKKLLTILIILISTTAYTNDNLTIENLNNKIEKSETSTMSQLLNNLEFKGTIETQFKYSKIKDENISKNTTDLSLNKIELKFNLDLHRSAKAFLNFKYEDNQSFDIDEGGIYFSFTEKLPFYFKIGKFVIPFGLRESNFITDPYTTSLGETNSSAIEFGIENKNIYLNLFSFKSPYEKIYKNNKTLKYGGSLGAKFENLYLDDSNFVLNVSYISTISGATMFEEFATDNNFNNIKDDIAAVAYGFSMELKEVFASAEYMSAIDKFDAAFYNLGKNYKPETYNIELGYKTEYVKDMNLILSLKYEKALEFINEKSNLTIYGLLSKLDLYKLPKINSTINLGVEYLYKKYNSMNNKSNDLTIQLSANF